MVDAGVFVLLQLRKVVQADIHHLGDLHSDSARSRSVAVAMKSRVAQLPGERDGDRDWNLGTSQAKTWSRISSRF